MTSTHKYKIVRGGSWFIGARWCRSAFRDDWLRGLRRIDLGLRIVRRKV